MIKIDFSELKEYEKSMIESAKDMKNGRYTKTFLRNTGNKAQRRVRAQAVSAVKYDPKNNWTVGGKKYSPTGNLFAGQKRGKVYYYSPNEAFAVRVFGGAPAHHSNWLEYGHRIIMPDGTVYGSFEGYGFFQKGMQEYEPLFYEDLQKQVIDKVVERLGG